MMEKMYVARNSALYLPYNIIFVAQLLVEIPDKRSKYLNGCGIPNIRGNLKYPAKFGTNLQILPCSDAVEPIPYKMSKPDKCCAPCRGLENNTNIPADFFCPAGLEVCEKFRNFFQFLIELVVLTGLQKRM